MAGQKKSRRFGFEVVHQILEASVADVVLRNRLRIKNAVLEHGFAAHAEQHAQIFCDQGIQCFRRQRGEFRLAFAADVAGQRVKTGGRAVGKKRRRENRAEDFKTLHAGNQHAEALARMRHVLPPKSQHHAGHRRTADLGERGKIRQRLCRLDLQTGEASGRAAENYGGVLGRSG